jgi:drug/metabolite transporter superfamily protein YnfA
MAKVRVFREYWIYLRQEKRYWVAPVIIMLALFGLLFVFAQTSAVAPLIYTLF